MWWKFHHREDSDSSCSLTTKFCFGHKEKTAIKCVTEYDYLASCEPQTIARAECTSARTERSCESSFPRLFHLLKYMPISRETASPGIMLFLSACLQLTLSLPTINFYSYLPVRVGCKLIMIIPLISCFGLHPAFAH